MLTGLIQDDLSQNAGNNESKAHFNELQNSIICYSLNQNVLLPFLKNDKTILEMKVVEFLDFAKKSPDKINLYVQIKNKIKEYSALPNSKVIPRKLLLQEIDNLLDLIYEDIIKLDLLRLEFIEISKTIAAHINGDLKWLERFSTDYFIKKLTSEGKTINRIEFLPKLDGDQLGRRTRIHYVESEEKKEIIFFTKTHQNGSRRNEKNMLPVDPKELLVYKIFELASLGPKVHFFLNPLVVGGYFISTQDESFTKLSSKQKFFKTYGQIRSEIEEKSETSFKQCIVTSHLLQQLMHLWDLVTNPGNFGRVSISHQQFNHNKWRIIDFRVSRLDCYTNKTIAEEYLAGNGMEGYLDAVQRAIKDISSDERLSIAKQVITDFGSGKISFSTNKRKTPLSAAISQAFCYISKLLQNQYSLGCLGLDLSKELGRLQSLNLNSLQNDDILNQLNQVENAERGDLGQYVTSVLDNLVTLTVDINKVRINNVSKPQNISIGLK